MFHPNLQSSTPLPWRGARSLCEPARPDPSSFVPPHPLERFRVLDHQALPADVDLAHEIAIFEQLTLIALLGEPPRRDCARVESNAQPLRDLSYPSIVHARDGAPEAELAGGDRRSGRNIA